MHWIMGAVIRDVTRGSVIAFAQYVTSVKYGEKKAIVSGGDSDSGSLTRLLLQRRAVGRVQQLRSFLEQLNYYLKLVPNISTILYPLNSLLKHGVMWEWTAESEAAFRLAKEGLASSKVLTRYDPSLPLKMASDTSADSIEAVSSYTYSNESEQRYQVVKKKYAQI